MLVNGGYYLVAAEYYKVKADYGPYYKNALLYLACVDDVKDLSLEDRRQRAHDLCIAAILGETIYNFGELVSYPIPHAFETVPKMRDLTLDSYYIPFYRHSLGQSGSGSKL